MLTGAPCRLRKVSMKNLKHLPSMLSIVFAIACFNVLALGQTTEKNQIANVTGVGLSIRFDILTPNAGATLTVVGPDGEAFVKEFKSGNSPEYSLTDSKGERQPDGQYTYELRITPIISAEIKDALKAARAA